MQAIHSSVVNEIFDAGQTSMIESLAGFVRRATRGYPQLPFVGHEAAYTFVLSGGVHPNDSGYATIADQMIDASIPEPGTLIIVIGVVGLVAVRKFSIERPFGSSAPGPV